MINMNSKSITNSSPDPPFMVSFYSVICDRKFSTLRPYMVTQINASKNPASHGDQFGVKMELVVSQRKQIVLMIAPIMVA